MPPFDLFIKKMGVSHKYYLLKLFNIKSLVISKIKKKKFYMKILLNNERNNNNSLIILYN